MEKCDGKDSFPSIQDAYSANVSAVYYHFIPLYQVLQADILINNKQKDKYINFFKFWFQ